MEAHEFAIQRIHSVDRIYIDGFAATAEAAHYLYTAVTSSGLGLRASMSVHRGETRSLCIVGLSGSTGKVLQRLKRRAAGLGATLEVRRDLSELRVTGCDLSGAVAPCLEALATAQIEVVDLGLEVGLLFLLVPRQQSHMAVSSLYSALEQMGDL